MLSKKKNHESIDAENDSVAIIKKSPNPPFEMVDVSLLDILRQTVYKGRFAGRCSWNTYTEKVGISKEKQKDYINIYFSFALMMSKHFG